VDAIEVVIRQPGFPDRVIPLQEGRVRLGRADDNEIVLSDVGVSRRHAQIVVNGGEVTIEDLGSGNGTYYFGHRVKSQVMRDQDEVVIDPFVLQFQIKGGAVPIAPPALAEAVEDGPRIEVVVGNGMVGNRFPIVDGTLTMGRAEDRDVVVPDAASSRHHCQITLQNGEYVLHDNGSANGVFVNAVRVRECTLSNGDLIRIGNTEMRFVHPAVASAPTQNLGNAAAWANEPVPDAGAIPIEPSSNPVATVLKHPEEADDDPVDEEQEGAGGKAGLVVAALAAVLIVVGSGALAVVGVAGAAWFFANPNVEVVEVTSAPLAWSLELPAMPESTNKELIDEAMAKAGEGDYRVTFQNLYRVLQAQPEDTTAKKFSAFAGEMLVVGALEAELTDRLGAERERVAERDRLLADLRDRRLSVRNRAKSRLRNNYREDPVVLAYNEKNPREFSGVWGLTNRQQNHRDQLQKMEREVATEQYEKAIRTGQRLLEDAFEEEVRTGVREQMAAAEKALAEKVAVVWQAGVMGAATGETEQAEKDLKKLLTVNQYNRSAELRLEQLRSRP
jgi:pSer/pThr/pTyr-binding forkhead associated (FHA) protein